MKDVMIDLETFGNGPNAVVVQIGAAYFNRVTGEVGETFKRNIDARSYAGKGFGQMDPDTLYWWLSQNREAIDSITKGMSLDPVGETFAALNIFLSKASCIWSHATFDFVIMSETMKKLKIKTSFRYSSARDIRTLTDLAKFDFNSFVRTGTHHDALDDVLNQIRYCVDCLNKLNLPAPAKLAMEEQL